MLKRVFVLAVIGLLLGCSGVFAATLDLPRTGQTLCYDATGAEIPCTGTGQDGELQLGIEWPNPRFDAAGGCVTDNLTGLMWVASPTITHTTWQGALDYANSLDLCGYQDWRLPNVNELLSLVNTGMNDTSVWLNSQGFGSLMPSLYWTSSTRADNVSYAWMVSLWSGNATNGGKLVPTPHYALPVRGSTTGSTPVWRTGRITCYDEAGTLRNCAGTGEDGEYQAGVAWPEPRFVVGSGAEADCITDQLTDLMWLRTPNITTTVTWQDALIDANNLSACGHSDWRLPNWYELRSLANYAQSTLSEWLKNPAQGFTGVTGGFYWSSTSKQGSVPAASEAWVFSATTSGTIGYAKTDIVDPHGAWAVRGPAPITPEPNIIVDPTAINFGYVLVNNPSTARTVTIRNGGTANLEVSSTSTTSGLFTVATGGANPCTDTTPTLTPAQSCTLVVTFTPTALGPQSATLNIASNDPDTATAQVALTGTGTDQLVSDISVDPTSINFSSVTVGQSSSQTLTIASQGTADLVISQTEFTGTSSSMFSVATGGPNPCASTTPTIPYGTSCTLSITFAPTALGAHEAYFNITSNDPDNSPFTVALTGTGGSTALQVIRPNGGETIAGGSSETIEWSPEQGMDNYRVKYSCNKGTTWVTLTKSTADTSYTWDPVKLYGKNKTNKCLIKVIGFNGKTKVRSDVSDNLFSVDVLTVTTPAAGATLTGGFSYNISWATGSLPAIISQQVLYSTNNGQTWKAAAGDFTDPGNFSWVVPNVAKNKCKVKIVLRDGTGKKYTGISDIFVIALAP